MANYTRNNEIISGAEGKMDYHTLTSSADSVLVTNVTVVSGGSVPVPDYWEPYTVNGGVMIYDGKDANDTMNARNLKIEGGLFQYLGGDQNDNLSINGANVSGGSLKANGGWDEDTLNVSNVTISGGNTYVHGDTGTDNVSVSKVSVTGGTFQQRDHGRSNVNTASEVTIQGGHFELSTGILERVGNDPLDASSVVESIGGSNTLSANKISMTGSQSSLAVYSEGANNSIKVSDVTITGGYTSIRGGVTANVKGEQGKDTISVSNFNLTRPSGYNSEGGEVTISGGGSNNNVSVSNVSVSGYTSNTYTKDGFYISGGVSNNNVSVSNLTLNGAGRAYVEDGTSGGGTTSLKNITFGGNTYTSLRAKGDTVSADGVNFAYSGYLSLSGNGDISAQNILNTVGGGVSMAGSSGVDKISLENVTMSSGTVSLNGNGGNDNFSVDNVSMTGGNIYVIGGNGNASVSVSNIDKTSGYFDIDMGGSDSAASGNDTISVENISNAQRSGFDIYARGGADSISIKNSSSSSTIQGYLRAYGGSGKDSIYVENISVTGYYSGSSIDGGADDDFISVKNSGVNIYGEDGKDTISVDGYGGNIDGGAGDDSISATNLTESINGNFYGGAGNDTIEFFDTWMPYYNAYSGGGAVTGDAGNDLITAKNATIHGTGFFGGDGNDTISVDNSTLTSTARFYNGAGNDYISVSNIAGNVDGDVMFYSEYSTYASDGNDTISLDNWTLTGDSAQRILINGNIFTTDNSSINGADSISLKNITAPRATFYIYGKGGGDNLSVENVTLGGLGTSYGDTYMGSGNIYASLDSGDDSISFNNLEFYKGSSSKVSINGGAGNDTIYFDGATLGSEEDGRYTQAHLKIEGGDGADVINVSNVSVTGTYSDGSIYGGAGDDKISVVDSNGAQITGGDGNDTIYFDGNVDAVLTDLSTSDAISLSGEYSQAYYKSDKNILVYGEGVKVSLGGVSDFSTLSSLKIYNGSTQTTVGEFVSVLEWKLENGVASYGDLIKISGLSDSATWSNITVDGKAINTLDDEEIKASGKPVVISNSALDTSKTVTITNGYTLALGSDVTDLPKDVPEHWEISSGNAAYFATGQSAGYVLADNTISYQSEQKGEVVTEVSGLSDAATLNDISLDDKVVTVSNNALDSSKTVSITNGYTLALGDDVTTSEDVDATWTVDNGTATYKGGKSAGYTLSDNTITYSPAVSGETLATITGLKSTTTVSGITTSGTTITLKASVLDQKEVQLNGDGYTLALANDVETPTSVSASWKVSDGTANYRGSTTAGYVVDGNKVVYQAESEDEIITTITSLSDSATEADISLDNKVATVKNNALAAEKTVEISNGYHLALGSDVIGPTVLPPYWQISDGTANYMKGATTAGFVLDEDTTTIYQQKENAGESQIEITSLSDSATEADISLSGEVVTISNNALDSSKVVKVTSGYTLALGSDVTEPQDVAEHFEVSEGKAAYFATGLSAGYVLADNQISYQSEQKGSTILEISGLSSNATNNDISLNNGILTLSASAIGTDTITIEKAVGVSKISAGKAGNFLIGTQTFTTATPVDFDIDENTKVTAIQMAEVTAGSFTNSADNIKIFGGGGNDSITSSADNVTISGNFGNDTLTNSGDNAVFQYTKGDGNDVIIGFTENDLLKIVDDTYNTSIVGDDLWVNLVESRNNIILKDAATITPNIEGTWSYGYKDKDDKEIENPVAMIASGDDTYYYESVARATNDADNNSTVTVIANSTETSAINTTKNLTIQFAESGLGVYNVTGGNFISADSSQVAQFSLTSNRILSNSNSLLINSGATATLDGYAITGTSSGYSFDLQENSFTLNEISYSGEGTVTFNTSGNVSLTSGAIVTTTKTATIHLTTGSYTINDVAITTAATNTAFTTTDGVKFNLSTDAVTYNSMAFSGKGTAIFADEIILTSGAIVASVPAEHTFIFSGAGTYKLNNKTIVSSATSLTVTNTENGLTIGENIFSVTGDDEFTLKVDAEGNIVSVAGIDGGSTIINAGRADSILTSSSGNFTFAQDDNKIFAISGDDSVIFGLTSDGTVTKIADVVGTIGGDFTSAININGNAADVQIVGDSAVTVTTTANGISSISGVSNGASVKGVGGASIVSTDEVGNFNFYDSQNFTLTGDDSIDFNVNNSVVTGVNNFENGTFQFDNTSQISVNSAKITTQFTDTATFIIADSEVVSVDGVTLINGLSNANVHASGNVTVNSSNVNVNGDNDFNVVVENSKTVGLNNISSGATVSVSNIFVTTDSNGTFQIGKNVYTINDDDGSITFTTSNNGAVENITNFAGTLKTSAQNVTVNGAAFATTNTDASIISAGVGISAIQGLVSGDTISGDLNLAAALIPGTTNTDINILTINERSYSLGNDSDGVSITGNIIDGLNSGASLTVGAAGSYLVNNTPLNAKIGDVFIGTSEGAAYIYDPNNVPLDTTSMSDDEIAVQAGVSTNYNVCETDTEKAAALLASGENLNGSMELALSNSDTTNSQTADFSSSTGKKKVTLEDGTQEIKFNDEGGNVAVIESDSEGEKNIELGNGGDLVIVKETETPVNITAGNGKDTIVTAGNNVKVDMTGGATKIVPNSGNVEVTNYDASTGAGIQVDGVSDIERAVQNGNIELNNGAISFGNATVNLGTSESESTTVNLYDNRGRKQKVAYTHSDGGSIDATNDRENVLLVGNHNSTKSNGSSLTSGRGNDVAFGGAGDYFDLGGGNNKVYLNQNRGNNSSGATVAMTSTSGRTEVNGFNSGFGDDGDKISMNIFGANVSYKNGTLTFSVGNASLILNFIGSSADLIADNNFIGNDVQLDEITPITFEQGDYQNAYELGNSQDTLSGSTDITFTGA